MLIVLLALVLTVGTPLSFYELASTDEIHQCYDEGPPPSWCPDWTQDDPVDRAWGSGWCTCTAKFCAREACNRCTCSDGSTFLSF